MKRITDIIVVDQDNYYLPFQEINNFLKSNKLISPNRLKKYTYDLIQYFNWLEQNCKHYLTVTERDIIDYRDYLIREPDQRYKISKLKKENPNITFYKPKIKRSSTINEKISVIRQFYDYLLQHKEIFFNPCPLKVIAKPSHSNQGILSHTKYSLMHIDTLKVKENDMGIVEPANIYEDGLLYDDDDNREPLTKEEVQQVISFLKNPQELLLICLLFLGMRISEPLGRRTNDILWADRIVRIIKRDDDPPSGRVKYGSYRDVPIQSVLFFNNLPDVMYYAYKKYVDTVLRPKREVNVHNYLFITLQGRTAPLTYGDIYTRILINNLQKNIKSRKITFHTFRHHFSTTSIAMGVPIEAVQKVLGHQYASETINDYYHPSLKFIEYLVRQGIINDSTAEQRIDYLVDYKKKFGNNAHIK